MATDEDIFKIENMIKNGKIEKYFNITRLGYNKNILSAKEILTKNVIFKQASITKGLDEVQKDENNIILARNFWKYLSKEGLMEASWKLHEKINEKSLIIIGNFDLGKNGYSPFFIDALGLVSHSENDLSENILSKSVLFKAGRLKDKATWMEYIDSNYQFYIPSYIK